jgi:hypothetical protein
MSKSPMANPRLSGQLPFAVSGEIDAPELLVRDVSFQEDQRIYP